MDVCTLRGNIQWNSQRKWELEVGNAKFLSGSDMEGQSACASVTCRAGRGDSRAVPAVVAEGTTSAVQLLHKVLSLLSPSLSVCVELSDLSDLLWKLGVVPSLKSRKHLKVPVGSVHCS